MNAHDAIRGWVASRQGAEEREAAELRRAPPTPTESFAAAMSLIAFAAARHGWPLPAEEQEEAENLAFHQMWARLRRRAGVV